MSYKLFAKAYAVLLCFSFSGFLFGQTGDTFPGYVVDLSGDTIPVEIVNQKDYTNSVEIKRLAHAEFETLTAKEIKGFAATNGKVRYVTITHKYTNPATGLSSSRQKFAGLMIGGNINLYKVIREPDEYYRKYANIEPTTYYVEDERGAFYELGQYEKKMGETNFKLIDKYKGVLNYVLRDWPFIENETNELIYSSVAIVELVSKYNKKIGNDPIVSTPLVGKGKKKQNMLLHAYLPISIGGEEPYKSGYGLGILYLSRSQLMRGRLSYGAGFGWRKDFYNRLFSNGRNVQTTSYRIPLTLKYDLSGSGNITPFIEGMIVPEYRFNLRGNDGVFARAGVGLGVAFGSLQVVVKAERDVKKSIERINPFGRQTFALFGLRYSII